MLKPKNPALVYPGLVLHLAKISQKALELYDLTKTPEIAKQLGISRQTLQFHIDTKVKKERKDTAHDKHK